MMDFVIHVPAQAIVSPLVTKAFEALGLASQVGDVLLQIDIDLIALSCLKRLVSYASINWRQYLAALRG
jgi:hypothetical protein